MAKKILIILAEGFEEIEAATPVDIFRRAGAEVMVAGLGAQEITGAHGIIFRTDIRLEDAAAAGYDALVLPGGGNGARNLAASSKVLALIGEFSRRGGIIAAICASPAVVLAPAGILDGKRATCFPGMEDHFTSATTYVEEDVVTDGNIITSRGPGTAAEFSFVLLERIGMSAESSRIREAMLFG